MSEEPKAQNEDVVQTEKLKHALDEEKKRSEDYLMRLQYVQADFENLKKRTERQIQEAVKSAKERIIIDLLDIVDELELAVNSGRSSNSADILVEGVEMTLKKMRKFLENQHVYPIEALNKTFDPAKHHAVAKIERDDLEECIVVDEIRKGYIMEEKVIRPSIVKISVKPESKSQSGVCSNE